MDKEIDQKELENRLAKKLHTMFRKIYLRQDGTYESKWTEVSDRDFLEKLDRNNLPENIRINDKGVVELDITNTPYDNLSDDLKEEYKLNAQVAIIGLNCDAETWLDTMHNAWLERHPQARGGYLDVPADQLQRDESVKYYKWMVLAIETEQEIMAEKEQADEKANSDGEGK